MAAPTAGSTPFVPLGNEVSGPLTDPGSTALDNYEAWYMHMHGESSNKWFLGRDSSAVSAPWPASKIAARGVWTSNYRNGTYNSQANSDDPAVSPTNPLGGIAATADAAADTLTVTGTWAANGERFVIGANTVPGGLSLTQIYYVVNRSVAGGQTTFKAALTSGGAAINITSAGTSVRVAELQPTFGEARFAEQQIPLSIGVWWPGNYNSFGDGGGGTNACLSAAVNTAPAQGTADTITVNRVPDVELNHAGRVLAVPGTSTDLRRRTWPYGRLTDDASVVVTPCYTFGEYSTGCADNRFIDWVRIDDEIMQIRSEPTEVSGIVTIQVWRGAFGTTPATHAINAKVLAPAYVGSSGAAFNDSVYSGCPHRNDWTFTLRYGLRTIDPIAQDFMQAQTLLARNFDTDLQGYTALWLDIGGPSMYNLGSKWANPVSHWDVALGGRVSVHTGTANTQNYSYWQRGKYQGWQQRFPGIRVYTNAADPDQDDDSDALVGRVYMGSMAETFMNLDTMNDANFTDWMDTVFHSVAGNWPITWWVRRVNVSLGGDQYAKFSYASVLLAFNKRYYRSSRAITAATRVGQVATYTVGTTADLRSGDWMAIRGVTPQAYNTFARITVLTGTTFSLTLPSTPSGSGTVFGTAEGKPSWEFMDRWNESQPEGLYFFDLGEPIGSPKAVGDLDNPVAGLYRRDYS